MRFRVSFGLVLYCICVTECSLLVVGGLGYVSNCLLMKDLSEELQMLVVEFGRTM